MLFLVVTVIPALLIVLHFFSTPVTTNKLKSAIVDYYVEIGSLNNRDQTVATIRRIGIYIRRMRKWYIRFFVVAAATCFLSSVYGTATAPRIISEKALLGVVKFDLDAHFYVSRNLVMQRKVAASYFYRIGPWSCVKLKDSRPFVETKADQFEKLSTFVRALSDAQRSEIFVRSELTSDAYVFLTVLLAVQLSTRLTVLAMEWLVTSRIMIGVAFLLSIAVAVLSPFFLIELAVYAAASAAEASFGTIPDFYDLDVPTVANAGYAMANVSTVITMAPETIVHVLLLKFDLGSRVQAILFDAYSLLVLPMMSLHFVDFVGQLRQFNAFDFNISEMNGIRNWGVFTDLAFSTSYILVTYLLRLAAVSTAVR